MKSWKLFALAAMLSASSQVALAADAELIAAAEKEGVVTWYVSLIQDQAVRPMVKAFEAQYPNVKVDVVGGSASDLLTKINSELDAGQLQADVHHGGGTEARLTARGALASYRPDSASNIPETLQDKDSHWTAQVVSYLVPAYNTDLVSAEDAPKTLDDLLDPRWKGKIAWTNAMTQGGPPGFIGAVLELLGEEGGMQYLRALAEQDIINVPANQRVVLDQLIQGEFPLVLQSFSHHSDISAAVGAPVAWIPLLPAVATTMDPAFVMKDAPHPNAARLLLDFLFSDAGQTVLRDANYIPANPKLRAAGLDIATVAITPSKVTAHLDEWIKVYEELFR